MTYDVSFLVLFYHFIGMIAKKCSLFGIFLLDWGPLYSGGFRLQKDFDFMFSPMEIRPMRTERMLLSLYCSA